MMSSELGAMQATAEYEKLVTKNGTCYPGCERIVCSRICLELIEIIRACFSELSMLRATFWELH